MIGLSSDFSYPMGIYREVRVFQGYTVKRHKLQQGKIWLDVGKKIHIVGG